MYYVSRKAQAISLEVSKLSFLFDCLEESCHYRRRMNVVHKGGLSSLSMLTTQAIHFGAVGVESKTTTVIAHSLVQKVSLEKVVKFSF